ACGETTGSPGRSEWLGGPGSEQHAHERADLPETHPAVGAAGGGVEVVDVEADDGGDVGEGVAQDGGHAGGGHPGAPVLGGDPDALDLAGAVGRGTDLGFEGHFAVGVEPGEGTSRPDEFGDPGLVEQAAVAGQRGDADLLGEHGDAGRHDRFHLVLADAPDVGGRGDV